MPTEIAIAVVEHAGSYLVGQRSGEVVLSGYWEFPGGKVEPGESASDAAARECLEEAGVAVRIVGEYESKLQTYDHGELHLRFFAAEPIDSNAKPSGGFQYVQLAELANLNFPAGNLELVEHLINGAPESS